MRCGENRRDDESKDVTEKEGEWDCNFEAIGVMVMKEKQKKEREKRVIKKMFPPTFWSAGIGDFFLVFLRATSLDRQFVCFAGHTMTGTYSRQGTLDCPQCGCS